MAGHYYYDPRPFYGHNNHTGLMPLDELFYGRYEPVPYWQDQRMAPLSMFEDNYYGGPGAKQQMVRRPEIMQQQYVPQRGENNFMPYKRPELVRDDIYTDMYRRSPYNFNYNNYGVAVAPGMHPEILRQQQPASRQSQDDTWVHAMSAPAPFGHGHHSFRGLPEPPPAAMPPRAPFGTATGTGTGIDQYRPTSNGNDQYQMPVNSHNQNSQSHNQNSQSHNQNSQSHNQSSHNNSNSNSNSSSNNHGNGNSHGSKQSMGVSSQQNGSFGTQGKSLGQGGKSAVLQTATMSKQLTSGGNNNNNNNHNNHNNHSNSNSNAKRYNDDSSSSDSEDDDDDEYHNNGGKWSTVKSGTKHGHSGKAASAHGHKGDSHSQGYQSNSKNSSVSMSSKKSSSHGHGSYGSSTPGKHSSGGKHGSSQSKISKLLRFQDDSSSSEDDDESYGGGHSKKTGSSKGSHQTHGSHVSNFQPNSYASQPKQMQFSSQSKSVELKVPICCDNCERKVRSCLEKMDGVESVLCDQWNRKVIVYGNLKAENVLKRVRRVKKTSELWQHAKQPQQQLQQLRLY